MGAITGALVGLGTSLLIKTSGRLLVAAGGVVISTVTSPSSGGRPQDGFSCGALAPGITLTECETAEGEVVVTLGHAPPEGDDDSFVMVSASDAGEVGPIPFQDECGDGSEPAIPVGIPVPGWVVEHRCVGPVTGDTPWMAAVWDVATSSYIVPVEEGVPDADVQLRARPCATQAVDAGVTA